METINILNKKGFLTAEDRKKPLVHYCNHVTFETCIDLSEPIKVKAFSSFSDEIRTLSIDAYSKDVASFISWWTHFVWKDLNGFQGFGGFQGFESVEFVPVNFKK